MPLTVEHYCYVYILQPGEDICLNFSTFFLSRKRQPIHPFASVTLVTQPLHNSNNIQIYFYIVHDYSLPEDCKLFEHIEFMSFITLSLGLRRLLGT